MTTFGITEVSTLPYRPFVPPTSRREKGGCSHFSLADSATTTAEFAVAPDTKNIFFRYDRTAKSAKNRSLKIPRLGLSSVVTMKITAMPALPYPLFVLSEGRGLYIQPQSAGSTTPCRSRRTGPLQPRRGTRATPCRSPIPAPNGPRTLHCRVAFPDTTQLRTKHNNSTNSTLPRYNNLIPRYDRCRVQLRRIQHISSRHPVRVPPRLPHRTSGGR